MAFGSLNNTDSLHFSLGIDTGGTYTDAVVFSQASGVVGKAKALTTKSDLSVGIAQAVRKALASTLSNTISNVHVAAANINLVSVSTTLATNALVEGHGDPAALVLIGFTRADVEKSGLAEALGSDPHVLIEGGHDVHGNPKPFDLSPLDAFLNANQSNVSGFAVAGMFATRNPAHELAAKKIIVQKTGLPVTCSHELSAKLGGPKRALTTLLNARLIGINSRLVRATKAFLKTEGIEAPLMVVRGDGSLVSADFAANRPIETILSGPAASLVGAQYLTQAKSAIVSDIGGTTTDIAILENGNPKIDPDGAMVGGYRTMVEAVAMHTFGLGGDSQVHIDEANKTTKLRLGPKRAVPISLLAEEHGNLVRDALQKQLREDRVSERAGQFVFRLGNSVQQFAGLNANEAALMNVIQDAPTELAELIQRSSQMPVLQRLVLRGLVQVSSFTPSDAMHVLGTSAMWDVEAARLGAELLARRKDRFGEPLAESAEAISAIVKSQLVYQSADFILRAALADDGVVPENQRADIIDLSLRSVGKTAQFSIILDKPVIGLGASAPTYYPLISKLLGTKGNEPDNCEVCNAIGAVAGNVRQSLSVEVTSPDGGGSFSVFADAGSQRFNNEEAALAYARDSLTEKITDQANQAGANNPQIHIDVLIDAPQIEGSRQFIQAKLTAIATGRPAVAKPVKP